MEQSTFNNWLKTQKDILFSLFEAGDSPGKRNYEDTNVPPSVYEEIEANAAKRAADVADGLLKYGKDKPDFMTPEQAEYLQKIKNNLCHS